MPHLPDGVTVNEPKTREPSWPEIRRAAYSVVASASLGGEYPGDNIWRNAVDIVLSDDRKSRTKAERAVQQSILFSSWFVKAARFVAERAAEAKALR